MLKISREANDVYVAMQLGLGSNRIAAGLGITHAAVLSRQNNLEKLGIISKGTMDGTRRQIILGPDQFEVEPLHRGTVKARLAADRAEVAARETRLANLAKAREARKAKKAPVEAVLEPVGA